MIGSAREFFIKRVLKSILPPTIHIGSGKIVDSKDNSSKQVDIIIYDSRFPFFEIETGIGNYLCEGVIATIEVKSTLNEKELINSLNNSKSILELSINVLFSQNIKITRELTYRNLPASYIFAYNSKLNQSKTCDIVDKWFEKSGKPALFDGHCAQLPRVIVAGQIIGLLDDEIIDLHPGEDVLKNWSTDPSIKPKIIMAFCKTSNRFGFLMIHLLHTISNRFDLSNLKYNIEYSINQYLLNLNYFETELMNKEINFVLY